MTDAAHVRELITRFHAKDRVALNRLVSLVARGESIDLIRAEFSADGPDVRLIALTGNSGVGKSTLTGQLISEIRSRDQTVAVLACDPESALTGGALLGDRVRMSAHTGDDGVWIRSLAAASGRQAITDHLDLAASLLGRFGFEHVLLETVGAGQGDVAVESLADVVVLLIQPATGDQLQWEKAGVLEVADVVVVHKGDLPGAERTETQVREALNLPGCSETPVLRISSVTREGIAELWSVLEGHSSITISARRNARSLLRVVQDQLAKYFSDSPETVQMVVEQWVDGRLNNVEAADQVLADLIRADCAVTAPAAKNNTP